MHKQFLDCSLFKQDRARFYKRFGQTAKKYGKGFVREACNEYQNTDGQYEQNTDY